MTRAIPADETSELALHEAGHAAIALHRKVQRPRILYVTIEPGRQGAAQTRFKEASILPPKEYAMVCIAGVAAQVYGCLKRNPGADLVAAFAEYEDRSRHDLALLEQNYGFRGFAVLELMRECMRRIGPIWSRVEALARELAKTECRTLYHEEAAWIFDGRHHLLEKYRALRKPVDPHPKWLDGFESGKAGPWYEDMDAMRVSWEALKTNVQSRIQSHLERLLGG